MILSLNNQIFLHLPDVHLSSFVHDKAAILLMHSLQKGVKSLSIYHLIGVLCAQNTESTDSGVGRSQVWQLLRAAYTTEYTQ